MNEDNREQVLNIIRRTAECVQNKCEGQEMVFDVTVENAIEEMNHKFMNGEF